MHETPRTRQLVIATHNSHKTAEFRALLGGQWQVLDLKSLGHDCPPEETGTTFLENASIKALAASTVLGDDALVVADDSGLEVDALGLHPGVYSSRYAGPNATDADNRAKLLAELAKVGARGKARAGRFRCVLATAKGPNILAHFEGSVEGVIANHESGTGGFGYDSLFIPDGHCETFGQLPAATKNQISHRSRALAKLLAWLSGQP